MIDSYHSSQLPMSVQQRQDAGCSSRFPTLSSLLHQLSPTRTLKRAASSHVQITRNASGIYHVQHVVWPMVCKDSQGVEFDRVETVFTLAVSARDGIIPLGKAHTRSAPSLSSLPKVPLETVPFVWLNTDRSRPWRVKCQPLPFFFFFFFSIPLFGRSVL